MTSAENLALAFGALKCGSSWTAHCLAHDDRNPSLSIREGYDGKVLVHCFAGCEQKAVLNALLARSLWPIAPSNCASSKPASARPGILRFPLMWYRTACKPHLPS
jgi:hypothetical protein